MGNRTEKARAQVYLDGKQAELVITQLKKKSRELRDALGKAVKIGDPAAINKIKRELKGVTAATGSLKKETYDYTKVLKNINGAAFKELTKALRTVNAEYSKLKPKTKADFALRSKLAKQISIIKTKQRELNVETRAYTSTWSKVTGFLNKNIGTVMSITAVFSAAAMGLSSFIEGLTGLSDKLANVMKTTKLTKEEVRSLYSQFKTLNTRTKKSLLLQYAEEAGRLGKTGKKDIMAFVEQANKIGVSLGDDLGDVQMATRTVGKMVDIYNVGAEYGVDFGEAMNKMGSGINEVAANSSASAPYLVEYVKRMAGLAEASGISASAVIGYASVLDQSGQKIEMSATSQQKIMLNMYSDIAGYADMAGVSASDFATLLDTDINEAFLVLLEGLNGNEQGMIAMTGKLKDLGITGTRAVGVISVLAANTGKVRAEQDLANKAMTEGVSLTDEYNIKNDNLAGSWEKIQKRMRAVFMNVTLIETFEKTISNLATSMEDGSFNKFLKVFKNIAVATVAYIAVQKIAYKWSKLTAVLTRARIITKALLNGKINLLTKSTIRQTIAQKASNKAVQANLYAAIAAAVLLLVTKLVQLYKAQVKVDKSHKAYINNLSQEDGHVNSLFETYKKLNPESKAAKDIRKELNTLYPSLMQNYIDEKGHIINIADAQKLVNTELIRGIALRSKEEELSTLGGKAFSKEKKGVQHIIKKTDDPVKQGAAAAILQAKMEGLKSGAISVKDLYVELATVMEIPISDAHITRQSNSILVDLQRIKDSSDDLKEATMQVDLFYSSFLGVSSKESNPLGLPKVADKMKIDSTVEPIPDEEIELSDVSLTDGLDRQWQERKLVLEKQYAEEGVLSAMSKAKMLAEEIAYLKVKQAILERNGKDSLSVRQNIQGKEMDLENQLWTLDEADMLAQWDASLAADQAEIDALTTKNATIEEENARHSAAMLAEKVAANQLKRDEESRNAELIMGLSQDMGVLIGGSIADSEASMENFGKNMVLIALKTMKSMIPIWAAKIVGGSLATPQSILTGGIAGVAQAAGLSGLMYAAVSGVEVAVKSSLNKGYYDGGDTGSGNPREIAGVVHKSEFVANHKATANPDVKQFLDVIDIAQRNNTIGSLRVPDILSSVSRGSGSSVQDGGSPSSVSVNSASPASSPVVEQKISFPLFADSGNSGITNLSDAIVKVLKVAENIK